MSTTDEREELELWEGMFGNAAYAEGTGTPAIVHYAEFIKRVKAYAQQREVTSYEKGVRDAYETIDDVEQIHLFESADEVLETLIQQQQES